MTIENASRHVVDIAVKNDAAKKASQHMGCVSLNLSQFDNFRTTVSAWYVYLSFIYKIHLIYKLTTLKLFAVKCVNYVNIDE